jgi:hypothetical protein
VLLLLLACLGPAALAGTPVTVQQLDQLLTTLRNRPDGKVAKQLFGLELAERASSLRLRQWQAEFPGKQTREALLMLADASAFLDFPASEILPMAVPDTDEQDWTFSLAVEYAVKMASDLPIVSARRSTTHFSNRPPDASDAYRFYTGAFWEQADASPTIPQPFYVVDRTANIVSYRDGYAVKRSEVPEGSELEPRGIVSLTTAGEFGPLISTVVGDAVNGQVSWGHWEQGATGPLAVLHYAVPQQMSHYIVQFGSSPETNEWTWSKPQFPAYHGEIAVDPESGTILRLTLEAELEPPYRGFKHAVVVEYGSVTIGDRSYTCPVKGVALSRIVLSGARETADPTNIRLVTYLNDVSFSEYRVISSGTRKLP